MIDLSILKNRSVKNVKRSLGRLSSYAFSINCFEDYFELCKIAYSGIVMPVFTFKPKLQSKELDVYGILRARRFEGELTDDPNFFWEPPNHKVKSLGRCNLIGESVFYASNHVSTALIESRAKVGELWFVGNFDVQKGSSFSCFALGHSDHTIMSQAQNFRNDFYFGWDELSEKKNRLVDDFIHRSFKKDYASDPLRYYETIGITNFFLRANNTKNVVQGITYPSVAAGIKGANFMIMKEFARSILQLSHVHLYRIESIDNEKIELSRMADSKVMNGYFNRWTYAFDSFKHLNFKKLT